jgi:FkbM family methyltransferase
MGCGDMVVAIEPETTASRLSENVRLNGLSNLRLFKMALSDSRATRRLALGDPEAVSQSAHLEDEGGPLELVQSIDFDSLVSSEGLSVPRVVKMEIEGHEFADLHGMQATFSSPLCLALFCEVHPLALPNSVTAEAVIGLIRSFGFGSIRSKRRFEQIQVNGTTRDTLGAGGIA